MHNKSSHRIVVKMVGAVTTFSVVTYVVAKQSSQKRETTRALLGFRKIEWHPLNWQTTAGTDMAAFLNKPSDFAPSLCKCPPAIK